MKLTEAITVLGRMGRNDGPRSVSAGMQLLVTIGFVVAVVSTPVLDPGRLVWFFCFPIIMAEALRLGYAHIFIRSLWFLPLILIVGVFNPIIDTTPCWVISGVVVSRGWVSFLSILLRGLLCVQALLVIIESCGFNDICRAMRRAGVPSVLVTQLLMLYRFLFVLLDEALTMQQAREARGFGRKSYPLRMWGTFIGQLLIRSLNRAGRINRAMLARGYDGGDMPTAPAPPLTLADWAYLVAWTLAIIAIRFLPLTLYLSNLLTHKV